MAMGLLNLKLAIPVGLRLISPLTMTVLKHRRYF
jgi:hypothetical protein